MKLQAFAKINLGLDVVRKREDGYHEVRMIMQNIGLCDELELTVTEESGIAVSTNREDLPTDEGNLVYKAAKLLMLNPIAQVIQDMRYCLITHEAITSWSLNGVGIVSFIPVVLVVVVIILAAFFFRKRSRKFAEEV